MICSISVSATGILAILLDFPVNVSTSQIVAAGEVKGSLYGTRYGADNQNINPLLLYSSSVGLKQQDLDYFTENVSFSDHSQEIEYIFKFVLDQDATSGVIIKLTKAFLDNEQGYDHTYQFAYGMIEPEDWSTQEKIEINKSYVVDNTRPYLYLRASLKLDTSGYRRVDVQATWSFTFFFEGITTQN